MKPRKPDSAQQALYDSIRALKPDPVTGLERWARAAMLTGASESALRQASDDSPPSGKTIPIREAWMAILDIANVREGGEPINGRAFAARHEAAIDGRELLAPSPEVHLQRAILELKAAAAAYEAGAGDPLAVQELSTAVGDHKNELLKVWARRERRARDRPADDERPPKPLRVVGGVGER